jgi:hypothetical protein
MADLAAFKKDLKRDLTNGREAFAGVFADELNELMGLSQDEIDRITPDGQDLEQYARLIAVVKQASRHNLNQAQLVSNIRDLGTVAVSIAKKAGGLAKLLV